MEGDQVLVHGPAADPVVACLAAARDRAPELDPAAEWLAAADLAPAHGPVVVIARPTAIFPRPAVDPAQAPVLDPAAELLAAARGRAQALARGRAEDVPAVEI